ncbi:hypothetical protein [Phyllobacterium phragmitis]|uniref:hypothetical protein n=1 Tax=Phyllobacterium phragmitis TaxID=2670329 RepID=UPI001305060E|nr:hypothetical protein [Phyllobacterium phragmitis]
MFSIFGIDGGTKSPVSFFFSRRDLQPEQSEQPEQYEQPEQPEQSEQYEQSEQPEQPEQSEQSEQPEQPEQYEQPEQPEQPEQYEQPEQPEQYEQSEQPEQLVQFLQSMRLSRAFCAASSVPKYSTLHLLPLVSLSHVVIGFPRVKTIGKCAP